MDGFEGQVKLEPDAFICQQWFAQQKADVEQRYST